MRFRMVRGFIAASLLILCACSGGGGSTGGGGAPLPIITASPPGPAIASLAITGLTPAFTIGIPSTRQVSVVAKDATGAVINGTFPLPVTISTTDTSGRISLAGSAIQNSTQSITVNYFGKGGAFPIRATAGNVSTTQTTVTTVPPEVLIATPGPLPVDVPGNSVFGSDGNLWSSISYNYAFAVMRITTAGKLSMFSDPIATHWFDSGAIARGSDGNVWAEFHDSRTENQGFDKITPDGQFTAYLLPGNMGYDSVTSMALGPDGAVWFGISGSAPGVSGVGRIDASGNISQVATTATPPYNLVFASDANLWFSFSGGVGEMTSGGVVTDYSIPGASGANPLKFILGTDGNFWAPYAYGTNQLIKFNTRGSVVSSTTLPYSTPWTSAANAPTTISSLAVDTGGDVFATDPRAQGLIRITAAGDVSEYPTYSTIVDLVQMSPLNVVVGANGMVYLLDAAMGSSASQGSAGGLTTIDLSTW